MSFRNLPAEGIIKVANATERTAYLANNGDVVEQLSDNALYAWNEASQSWILIASGIASTVSGPASSTNSALVLWDGTAGDTIKNSNVTYVGSTLTGPSSFTLTTSSGDLQLNATEEIGLLTTLDQNIDETISSSGSDIFNSLIIDLNLSGNVTAANYISHQHLIYVDEANAGHNISSSPTAYGLPGHVSGAYQLGSGTTDKLTAQLNTILTSTSGGVITDAIASVSNLLSSSSGTITNGYGYRVLAQNSASTFGSLYGFYIGSSDLTGTFTNKWGIYIDDSTVNSLHKGTIYGSDQASGNLTLGSTTNATKGYVVVEQDAGLKLSSVSSEIILAVPGTGLVIQETQSAVPATVSVFAADGDTTDNCAISLYGLGTSSQIVDTEALLIGYIASGPEFEIFSTASGTGTIRNVVLGNSDHTSVAVVAANGDFIVSDFATFDESDQVFRLQSAQIQQTGDLIVSDSLGLVVDNLFNQNIEYTEDITGTVNVGNAFITEFDIDNNGFDWTGGLPIPNISILSGISHLGSGTIDDMSSIGGSVECIDGGGTITRGRGIVSTSTVDSSGTITTLASFFVQAEAIDAGALIDSMIGLAFSATQDNGGVINNFYGIQLEDGAVDNPTTDFYFLKNDDADAQTYLAGGATVDGVFIADIPYAQVSDSTTQVLASATTEQVVTFNTDVLKNKVTHSTVTDSSKVQVDEDGIYRIEFGAQIELTGGAAATAYLWIRKNGVDVANTGATVTLVNSNDQKYVTQENIVSLVVGDYIELLFGGDSTSLQLVAVAAGVSPTRPASPSAEFTINKISD